MSECTRERSKVIGELAEHILSVRCNHVVRVAVDGIDGAGKTRLADELEETINKRGRRAIRVSVDSFHNLRAVRYEKGEDSPEGYYYDSFNYRAIIDELLIPLGPEGNGQYLNGVFDFRTDEPSQGKKQSAPASAVLLFDGIFLLRPELINYWDFSIFVDVDYPTAANRGIARDLSETDNQKEVESLRRRYDERYYPGQQIYFKEADPKGQARVILDNNDIDKPVINLN